ncbi:MAG: glycoside hydrolase family 9 protein [Muribaculaceae bacterium]|nr:glycoside hydrolase family 9 protein [Muribaculaceae bacterium]
MAAGTGMGRIPLLFTHSQYAFLFLYTMSPARIAVACLTAMSLSAAALFSISSYARGSFDSALMRSGYIHEPLRHTDGISLEDEALAKPVLDSVELRGSWGVWGERATLVPGDAVTMRVNFDTGSDRARGSAGDPDYALYGHAVATLDLGGVDLSDYNRLCLLIEPHCPGIRIVNINLAFNNRNAYGEGFNPPTGAHLIQLRPDTLNRCYLEIADLRRDCVDNISLSVSINGADLPVAAEALYTIRGISAQRVGEVEKLSGWEPAASHIIYSQSGYVAESPKTAICHESFAGHRYKIVRTTDNAEVLKGKISKQKSTIGTYGVIDFSKLTTPGSYCIVADGTSTAPFVIGDDSMWDSSCWRVLNYIFCQRCGYAVPGVHSLCHTDLYSLHNGLRRPFAGGWHDAGDLSQQTLQTADVAFALLELYESRRDTNPVLAARLREEALWGLDFVLRNRLGDGYHASSMGLLIWQDGIVGSHDDIESVRVQNLPYDNFLYSAYEAYAARILDDGTDPSLIHYLARAAREDYDYALCQFDSVGFGGWISPYEHTYCTSESQFMATASWAASQLYALTGDARYAGDARRHADYVLGCQCTEPLGDTGICGFFYRNPERRSVVHYIHQSREQQYMQALAELCRTQPSHPDCARWSRAIELYGGYIKSLMAYTAPYGMIPAGIYRDDEYLDKEAFFSVHLFPPADAADRFRAQAANGVHVAPGYFVKRFPVWFNIFNGNIAVHTSMGKAAAICANILGDDDLRDIAREQLYWIVGKNPFDQSLIYGEGARYPSLNNFSSGEIVGAMPVGIRSLADTDEPYWPQINNACYKEVWLTSAGKWLSLVAETDKS